jgi:hypothetical protein
MIDSSLIVRIENFEVAVITWEGLSNQAESC